MRSVCTTDEQKKAISQFCSNIHVILDIHSTVATKIKTQYTASRPFRLVWEGLASNLPQLLTLAPILRALATRRDFELHVVTDPEQSRLPGGLFRLDSRRLLARYFDRSVSMIGRKKRARKLYRHAILRSFRLISMIPSPQENPKTSSYCCGGWACL